MPVSGNEEMEVKSSVGQFSEYSAAIPIKKRRFPLIWPPSQSTEELPSLPTENESEQKGFSSPLLGLAILTDSIIATSSNTSAVEASLHTSGGAGSSNASGGAGSLNASAAAGGVDANGAAGTLNVASLVLSSTASSVTVGSNASSALETSNTSTVAASFSNLTTSIAASFSSFSDASEKTAPEKEKRSYDDTNVSIVQGNSNCLSVKLEEQNLAVHSSFLADIDSKGKLVATGESDNILKNSAKSELDLLGDDSFTLNIGKDKYIQKNVDVKCRLEVSTVFENPGLSLGFRDCLSAMASGNKKHGCLKQEKEEPISLNLSLSKGECDTQLGSNNVKPNANGADMLADRSNWDLNTTMDVWEGPANNNVGGERTTCMDDIKPLITSSGMPTKQQILEEIKHRAKIVMPSTLSSQQYNTEDLLGMGLTTPYIHLNSNQKPSGFSAKSDLHKVFPNVSSPGESLPVSKLTTANLKPVKSEPLDESIKTISAAVKAKPMGLLNATQVKCELVERCSSESTKSSTLSALNLVDARLIKPEPLHEAEQETLKNMKGSLNQSDDLLLRPLDTTSTIVHTSTDLSLHGDASTHAEHFIQAKETEPSGEGQIALKMISSAVHDFIESNISGEIDNSTSQNESYRMELTDVRLADSRGTVEGSVSDEEKINLSGDILEEDSYGSDYESDGYHELAAAMDTEHDGRAEDDFEDGEVRERVEDTEIEAPRSEGQEVVNRNDCDAGNRNLDFGVLVSDNHPSPSSIKEKETQSEHPGKTSTNNTIEFIDTSLNKDFNTVADEEAYLQESLAVEMPSSQTGEKRPIKTMPRKPLDVSENKEAVEGKEREQTSTQAFDTSQGTSVTIAQGADNAKITDSEGKSNLVLPEAETSLNGDDAGTDVNKGGSKSRIIDLPRASNLSSPSRTRTISGRTLQSQVGRERLPDVALEEDEFHPRGRDEAYGDGSHRFPRERHLDQPSRNNRITFMRGMMPDVALEEDKFHPRGRDEAYRDGSRRFSRERHQDQPSRNNRISFMRGRDLDFSTYNNNGKDGAFFGTGRGGRKILSDDSSIFPHLSSGRRSPGERDGPAAQGLPVVRRIPRNFSPSRCIGEDGSELVGLRHMRGFTNDCTEPMFAHSQPTFEGLDGPFVRGNREFSSVQRRVLPQIRSKSPTRLQTHSSGPWHSPRRISPDRFGGPLELPHQRSPAVYRLERLRSPDRPCFPGEMVLRRHVSPPYFSRTSNNFGDLDRGRDHGHPRSGIPNRSPSGRILFRNSRRLDIVDPRERNDDDDYFGGPMPSGRFHELGTDGHADERGRYGDRRGPVRPFRSPYSGTDTENFHLNAEGGPRSFRFCPEDDPELHERGNMREREFDRRIKNRPGNIPRKTRDIEQVGNFRHGGDWHYDGFDDISRVKRKRF
ncbi:hypothetical protein DITRI_Ditri12bG0082700 [Diplodiscus trichospermus]